MKNPRFTQNVYLLVREPQDSMRGAEPGESEMTPQIPRKSLHQLPRSSSF
jgi:hypothetical protein